MYNLLKAAALALVLAFGSIQPGSPLYPVRIAVENMTADEVTETKPQMEFAQEQADKIQQLADDDQNDACPDGNCDPVRDRDRDDGCPGDDCDDEGFTQRVNTVVPDHESDCPGSDCDGDQGDGSHEDGRPDGNSDQDGGGHEDGCPSGNCDGDQDGGSREDGCPGGDCGGNQGGGGHDGSGHGGGHR